MENRRKYRRFPRIPPDVIKAPLPIMHYDDRLDTVLRTPLRSDAARRTLYRQLLDILGQRGAARIDPDQVDSAYAMLAELMRRLPVEERAQIGEDAGRIAAPRLLALLALHEPEIARPAMVAARLEEHEWAALIPNLPPQVCDYLRERDDCSAALQELLDENCSNASVTVPHASLSPAERGGSTGDGDDAASPPPVALTSDTTRTIGELVRRIERFRQARGMGEPTPLPPPPAAPRLPLDERPHGEGGITAIEFTTDRQGRIVDAPPAIAPMVVGFALSEVGGRIARAVRRHLPIVDEPLTLPGAAAIAGAWQLDAMPVFDPESGRFLHMRGRLRRAAQMDAKAQERSEQLRQLLHELRTPVNAIQGFAEAIQQQVFGEVSHSYRAYAATIVSDCAAMMAGFEELERYARLTGGDLSLVGKGCDLAVVIPETLAQLATYTQPRVSGFKLDPELEPLPVAMSRAEGDRLLWRVLGTLASETAPGEFLPLDHARRENDVEITIGLPRSLAQCEGDEIFAGGICSAQSAISAGMFGSGFALRLARAETRSARGDLRRAVDSLVITLPLAPVVDSETFAETRSIVPDDTHDGA